MSKVALYPGMFDPLHNGHLDVITRASRLFDTVIVCVFVNAAKGALFSEGERVRMIERATRHLPGVRVDQSRDLVARYAVDRQVDVIIRGLRAVMDFDYEFQIALLNRKLAPELDTLFVLTSDQYAYLSSTMVKELARYRADVRPFVPDVVARALEGKFPAE